MNLFSDFESAIRNAKPPTRWQKFKNGGWLLWAVGAILLLAVYGLAHVVKFWVELLWTVT